MPLGLYVHTPYCLRKCRYCDFLSYASTDVERDAYVAALKREIALAGIAYHGVEFGTVYIGGGTPTTLGNRILLVIEDLRRRLVILPTAEFTVEGNPDAIDPSLARVLVEHGVNRLSIGVQSTNDDELHVLGRTYDFGDVAANIEAVRSVPGLALNLDLMYAIPGQTIATLEKSISDVLAFHPEHLSVYELTYEEGTPLYADVKAGRVAPVDEDAAVEMEQLVIRRLSDAGFHRYEISNFAKPGSECRHNLKYWRGQEYVGLGVGAVSYLNGWRISNSRTLELYTQALSEGRLPHDEAERLCTKKRLLEDLMLALRTTDGLAMGDIPPELRPVLLSYVDAPTHHDYFAVTPDHVAFTKEGMRVFNPLFVALTEALNL